MVTGANSGLGLVTARALAGLGADVVLVCRDAAKGEAAVAEVRRAGGRGSIELMLADFASLDQVRELATRFRAGGRPLHVLVNNAGLMLTERRTTRDGFEYTFGVNHLAPFLLTNLLLETLRASRPARVVNVASRAGMRVTLDLDDLQGERRWGGWHAYCVSKLCNALFNLELDRRLRGSGVTANCLHPGVIATGFGRESTGLWRWMLRAARLTMASPDKGAQTQIYLASSAEVEGQSGQYFVDCRPAAPSRAASDAETARRLWEVSERMVGLAAAAHP